MSIRWFLLGASCSLAIGCPQQGGLDAGVEPPNTADGGLDGGVAVDGGPGDAGEGGGEGEGEGECIHLYGLTDQLDDAGVIHYEDCPEPMFGTCNDGSCANTDTERQLVDLMLEVALARGYGDRIEIVLVREDPPLSAFAEVLVIADWARAHGHVYAELDEGGQVIRETVEATLPLYVPATLPSIDEIRGRLRECSPDLRVNFCRFVVDGRCPSNVSAALGGAGGYGTPSCVLAELFLWDTCIPDAGPSEVTCYPTDVPCCE